MINTCLFYVGLLCILCALVLYIYAEYHLCKKPPPKPKPPLVPFDEDEEAFYKKIEDIRAECHKAIQLADKATKYPGLNEDADLIAHYRTFTPKAAQLILSLIDAFEQSELLKDILREKYYAGKTNK